MTDTRSLRDALAMFRARNGLPSDETTARTWRCNIGPLVVRLPNFTWRRRAILAHDLHHVLTGYPCSLRGEFQIAAWEFGAGPMPHWGARVFCLPLVLIGVAWSPRRIWRAYCDGHASTSLHGERIDDVFLSAPVSVIDRRTKIHPVPYQGRRVRFFGLLAEAALILSTPFLIGTIAWLVVSR